MTARSKLYVVLHNSISIDNAYQGVSLDIGLHYRVLGQFKPDAHLVGSNTAKTGITAFYSSIPKEMESDFSKPTNRRRLPYWVIPDSKGILKGYLHLLRRYESCRDVLIFISKKTPKSYVEYLRRRDFDFHIVGEEKVDIKKAFACLVKQYHISKIVTDAGRTLGAILLNKGLVDEISILSSPQIVGNTKPKLFDGIYHPIQLRQISCKSINDHIWLRYLIIKKSNRR